MILFVSNYQGKCHISKHFLTWVAYSYYTFITIPFSMQNSSAADERNTNETQKDL